MNSFETTSISYCLPMGGLRPDKFFCFEGKMDQFANNTSGDRGGCRDKYCQALINFFVSLEMRQNETPRPSFRQAGAG